LKCLFTKFFLKGMSGEADSDNDGNVTNYELEKYLLTEVKKIVIEKKLTLLE